MPPRAQILVVEDTADIQRLLRDRLSPTHDVRIAACQVDAYAELEAREFDLVLLDLKLPVHPGDMAQSPDVGTDILATIRNRKLTKRGSPRPLPVVVMTAFGSEAKAVQCFSGLGADNYLTKPFKGRTLEEAVEKALLGSGKLRPAGGAAASIIRMAFHEETSAVLIESLEYGGRTYDLLAALRDPFVRDREALRDPERYEGVRGSCLASTLGVAEQTVRQRIRQFRSDVARKFEDQLGRAIDDNDIIENKRQWDGYRLNPVTVELVAWQELRDASAGK